MPELVSVTYDLRNADDELKMLFRAMLETDRVHNYLLSWYGEEEDESLDVSAQEGYRRLNGD